MFTQVPDEHSPVGRDMNASKVLVWRIVYSYSPYRAKNVSTCGKAPCLSKKANNDGTRRSRKTN
jgi:hypothetical protein